MKFPSHLNCDGKIVSEMGPCFVPWQLPLEVLTTMTMIEVLNGAIIRICNRPEVYGRENLAWKGIFALRQPVTRVYQQISLDIPTITLSNCAVVVLNITHMAQPQGFGCPYKRWRVFSWYNYTRLYWIMWQNTTECRYNAVQYCKIFHK